MNIASTEIMRLSRVSVSTRQDLVVVRFGRAEVLLFYQTATEITRALRMASKVAMRYEGLANQEWRTLALTDRGDGPILKAHPSYRRSGGTSNISRWHVGGKGSLVLLRFDDTTIKMHYADAFQLHTWIRRAVKHAKAWAGDCSRTLATIAHLTDVADTNHKYGHF